MREVEPGEVTHRVYVTKAATARRQAGGLAFNSQGAAYICPLSARMDFTYIFVSGYMPFVWTEYRPW